MAIPSRQFQRAVLSLEGEGLSLCRRRGCPLNVKREKEWQVVANNPPAHFHMDYPDTEFFKWTDMDNTIQLFMMEDVLWELPVIGKGIDFVDGPDQNVIFANDINLRIGSELEGSGRFPDTISGVRVPTWQRYVEALILLALSSRTDNGMCSYLVKELAYIIQYGDLQRLCHPAFTRFVLGIRHHTRPFRAVIAEALENLGPRLHIPRPGLTSAQWEFLLGETPK